MEAIRRLERVQLALGLGVVSCMLLVPGEGTAQEALLESSEQRIIQFKVSFGHADESFMLYVLEGTAAYITGQEPGTARLAMVPVLDHQDDLGLELRVFRSSDSARPRAPGEDFERIRGRFGFPTFLVTDRVIELEPVGVVTVDGRKATQISFKGRPSLSPSDPTSLGMCCITSSGVTTCGCAVSQGGQSCCAPQCCELFN